MATSSSASGGGAAGGAPGLKTYFKTPEGRHKLQYEKTHSPSVLHYNHSSGGKTVSEQMTVAYLKEKPVGQGSTPSTPSSSSGMRSAAARLLGTGNGSRTLSFAGSNGVSRAVSGSSRVGGGVGMSTGVGGSQAVANYDGKGTYIIFNTADTLFISDLNSHDKDPVKSIHFSNSNPLCHAFDSEAKDGHDLIVGVWSGDVYSMSLRQQLQDPGKKPVMSQHFINKDKDGTANSRCTCVAWVPEREGIFVVSNADGNLYVYDKSKDGNADWAFPTVRDQNQLMISHAKSTKSNPTARWHICQGAINAISFSPDGAYMATVGRDGYLRVFDFAKEQLIFGGKSYYGALLCCSWSADGKYILSGGEDDLVQVWSMDDRKMVAWGEGHTSWVSSVAFDSYWSPPSSDDAGENVMYRFGSVGQDTQLLLWDLAMDEIAVPLRHPSSGSPTFSSGSPSAHWDSACPPPTGVLQPSPRMRDVPKLSPLVAHRVHADPLSGLEFTSESIVTICREGLIKIWARPQHSENSQRPNSSELAAGNAISKDKMITSPNKAGASSSSFKQPSSVIFS
ncbi:hypothetical protein CFC21_056881 [Triticum aestivum]|uniref:Catabolite repression protein creC n=3 Tax=Triticum TaxID=4564 RepID=A0A9R0W8Z0_TRITD|nr:WD repeat-containing protein 20-like isoform X1 [Triticum aestivum]KAF7048064.1 hypothetical protein CFC21_056881 [Triticum aestivum]VAI03032.1 unnamed protein product [Triticum turgidum subsp. durum]